MSELSGPAELKTYVQQLATSLRGTDAAAAKKLDAVLARGGDLFERLAAHPELEQAVAKGSELLELGKLQTSRADSLGFSVSAPPKPTRLQGQVTLAEGAYTLKTAKGDTYRLAADPELWRTGVDDSLAGFIKDGPISVQGKLADDGKTFDVTGFALNRDGRYDTFTFGKVLSLGKDEVTLGVNNELVKVTDPELRRRLSSAFTLPVILPGAPTRNGDSLAYEGNPDRFFMMATLDAPSLQRPDEAHARPFFKANLDVMTLSGSEVTLLAPEKGPTRHNQQSKVWLEGNIVGQSEEGAPTTIDAAYVSGAAAGGPKLVATRPNPVLTR